MFSSKIIRIALLVVFAIGGLWLISRPSNLTPETASRQQAQLALAPGIRGDNVGPVTDIEVSLDRSVQRGRPVSPAEVDVRNVPSRASDVDELFEEYTNGRADIEANEGPISESAVQQLIAESAKQGVDRSVQNYQPSNNRALVSALSGNASFKSIDYTQSQQGVPPDPDITVGKDHVVVGVNTSFQVFDKSGNSLVGPMLFEDFWGSNCGTGASTMSYFDPFLDYDEAEGRYVLGITAYDTAVNGGDNGYACIAISKTDSANGQWWLYSFDGNPGGGADYFFDYPHLGVGQNALYLSSNMFGSSFVRNHVFAYDKTAMYAGSSADSVKFNVGSSNFTIQPAKMHGYNTGGWPTNGSEPHYFVDAQYGNNQNQLTVWEMSDPFGSGSSFTTAGTVNVNTYSLPVTQSQSGSGGTISGNDNRLLDVKYWGGTLYATHHVGCNPGGGTVNCIRWYEIDISSGSPSLLDQGTFSSSGEYRSFPAIAPNACGDLMVGYTKMSSSEFPSVYVAGRESTDASGQLKDETLVHAGETSYTAYDSAPRRWGDYTGMAIDPDGTTFWYLGEYSRNQTNADWSTWVGAYSFPGCNVGPTPTPGPTALPTSTPPPTATPGPISCTVYDSADIPVSISSSGTPSVSSVLNVASGGTIADVNVLNLNGTHTYISDLDFNLTSPQGTAVEVANFSACGSQDNFDLNLDDEGSGSWSCPPIGGGTYPPSNALSAFDDEDAAGTWTLRIDDNYNADGGSLNGWSLEICTEGTGPVPTATSVPPTATSVPPTATSVPPTATTVPPTATGVPPTATVVPPTATPPPSGNALIYASSSTNGNAGFAYRDEDILEYDTGTGTWSMYFDGSDVGVTSDVNAFVLLSDGSVLMSFNTTTTAGAAGSVDDSDIVKFIPTSTGTTTAGSFEMFFDGSDVGLTSNGEDIDAMAVSTDGKIVISTIGSFSVTGVSGADEDMIIFTASAFGSTTGGSFAMFFDGSDVALNNSSNEDVWGAYIADNGDISLSVKSTFAVTGVSGDGADIFTCGLGSTGSSTSCSYSMYFDGSANGFSGELMDAFTIVP